LRLGSKALLPTRKLALVVMGHPQPGPRGKSRPTQRGREPKAVCGRLVLEVPSRAAGKEAGKVERLIFSRPSDACPRQRWPTCKRETRS